MNQSPEDKLKLANEMARKGAKTGVQKILVPRAAVLTVSTIAGLANFLMIQRPQVIFSFKPLMLVLGLSIFLILSFYYFKAEARPHFMPTKEIPVMAKNPLLGRPSYLIFLVLMISVPILYYPFFFIKSLELHDRGSVWVSYLMGLFWFSYTYMGYEIDRYFVSKR